MLSQAEIGIIIRMWESIAPRAEEFGAEALFRMFTTFPHTKTYFAHKDISENSPFLRSHGKNVIDAVGLGAKHFNTLTTTMAQLSAFHAYILMIDPYNFKLLSHCILVTLSSWKGDEFSPEAHAAWDKYLSALSAVLAEKYR
ncbi:hemoglobin subunit alpha-D-like [Erpetoichthys calabaricus]|uniref:hemoglobin subunit alpha-D-like n=1 Tax=Erpetoichthys calabaricus TaxID=27687 RepID=UPI0022345D11|nr:hemoglobin subunit alpha-D-like [Erpetoichthys calabaricus]